MSQILIFIRNNVNVHCMVIAFTSVDECVSISPTEGDEDIGLGTDTVGVGMTLSCVQNIS